MADSVQHLAYELTRGSLSEQEQRLSDLRTRAGTILAAASIAGSFLAAKNGSIDTPAVLAIVAYLACVGAAIYVLLPHELVFEFRGSVVIELEYERGGGLEAAYAAVTEWLEEFHESNAVLWTLSITGTEKRGGSNGDKK